MGILANIKNTLSGKFEYKEKFMSEEEKQYIEDRFGESLQILFMTAKMLDWKITRDSIGDKGIYYLTFVAPDSANRAPYDTYCYQIIICPEAEWHVQVVQSPLDCMVYGDKSIMSSNIYTYDEIFKKLIKLISEN